jgi:hypothetical protein
MKKFIGEIMGGDGAYQQLDLSAETHRDAFDMLLEKAASSYAVPAEVEGKDESKFYWMYPKDTLRLTFSVWEVQ